MGDPVTAPNPKVLIPAVWRNAREWCIIVSLRVARLVLLRGVGGIRGTKGAPAQRDGATCLDDIRHERHDVWELAHIHVKMLQVIFLRLGRHDSASLSHRAQAT